MNHDHIFYCNSLIYIIFVLCSKKRLYVFLLQFSVTSNMCIRSMSINLWDKSHNAPVPYPTMHLFVTEMYTCVNICLTRWCIVGYLSDALWNLWDGIIGKAGPYFKINTLFPGSGIFNINTLVLREPYLYKGSFCMASSYWSSPQVYMAKFN